jgi:hypothetical protein
MSTLQCSYGVTAGQHGVDWVPGINFEASMRLRRSAQVNQLIAFLFPA